MIPKTVDLCIYNPLTKKTVFKISHPITVFGFDSKKPGKKDEVTVRVQSIINSMEPPLSGNPKQDFSA